MPMKRIKKTVRVVVLVALLACSTGWWWSYHRPAGFDRVDSSFLIAESAHGSLIVSRVDFDNPFIALGQLPGWHIFIGSCRMDDCAILADAWVGRHHLGFAFGVKHPPSPSDSVWILDDIGIPVETTYAASGLPVPPPHKYRQFVFVIPWWFITLFAGAMTLFVWKRTKPNCAGFLVSMAPS